MLYCGLTGTGVSYEGFGLVPNNSFITTDATGTITHLQCVSSSRLANIGQWIAPSGEDITSKPADPFDVTHGGETDPGFLSIRQAIGHSITTSFQGVYSCIIPDEDGLDSYLHVGIYPDSFSSKL